MSGTAAPRTHRTGEKLPPPDTAQSGSTDLGASETAPVRVKHLTCLPAHDFQCNNYADISNFSAIEIKCFTHTQTTPPPEHNMPYNPAIHNRHSIQLPEYDYVVES